MASSNSITTEPSPKHSPKVHHLPIKSPVHSDEKASQPHKCFVTEDATPSNFQKIVAEIAGTYFLIFMGCCSSLTFNEKLPVEAAPIAWGVVLMVAIFATGHISGAHFNPAVTIALAAIRKFNWKHVPMYILAQVLAATLASLTLRALFSHLDNIHPTMTQFAAPTTDLQAATWEVIATFFLMFTICAVATDHRANKGLAAIAVGGALLVDAMVIGPITGASMNPARSIGPAVASGVYKKLWIYIVAPSIGALAAAFVYSMLQVPEPGNQEDDNKSVFNKLFEPDTEP